MTIRMDRRTALGLGTVATAGTVFGTAVPAAADPAAAAADGVGPHGDDRERVFSLDGAYPSHARCPPPSGPASPTKAGWFVDARHEAGVIFDTAGAPLVTYALFADGQAGADDFGATHPAVQARARWGRRVMDLTAGLGGSGTTHRMHTYRPSNGG